MGDVEKRRDHRFLALLEVRVLPGDRIPADLKLATIDIGTGGARCASNRPVDADASLKMTLSLIGANPRGTVMVDVEAKVLRCTDRGGPIESRRYELALQFSHIEPEDRKRLQAYLNEL